MPVNESSALLEETRAVVAEEPQDVMKAVDTATQLHAAQRCCQTDREVRSDTN
jgi:hypothetical protein